MPEFYFYFQNARVQTIQTLFQLELQHINREKQRENICCICCSY